jgi:hypothetical protein
MSKPVKQTIKSTKGANLWAFLKSGPISTLSLIPPLIACLLVITWAITKQKFFPSAPQIYNYAVLSVALVLVGFVGIIYIYRKEMPGPVPSVTIKGKLAVATGFALPLFFWILGIAGFVFALME